MSRTRVRRRRLVAGGLLVVALSVTAPAVSGAMTGGSAPGAAAGERYVVQRGDTLWSIAVGRAPRVDPRPVVQAIADANRIDAGSLVPGQVLVIPA
jgi:nucleoid-associated protein YgaU